MLPMPTRQPFDKLEVDAEMRTVQVGPEVSSLIGRASILCGSRAKAWLHRNREAFLHVDLTLAMCSRTAPGLLRVAAEYDGCDDHGVNIIAA